MIDLIGCIAIVYFLALFIVWIMKIFMWGFIIITAVLVLIILFVISSFSDSKKPTDEEVAQYIKETEENFIRDSKKYILDFIKETNPNFDISRKYTDDELNELKSRLEKDKINVPRLERYMKYSPNTKIHFLKDLIQEEIRKQNKK